MFGEFVEILQKGSKRNRFVDREKAQSFNNPSTTWDNSPIDRSDLIFPVLTQQPRYGKSEGLPHQVTKRPSQLLGHECKRKSLQEKTVLELHQTSDRPPIGSLPQFLIRDLVSTTLLGEQIASGGGAAGTSRDTTFFLSAFWRRPTQSMIPDTPRYHPGCQ